MKILTTIYCENILSVVHNVLKVFILMNKAHGWRATNWEAALDLKKKKRKTFWTFATSVATKAQVLSQPAAFLTGFVGGSCVLLHHTSNRTFPHNSSGKEGMQKVNAFATCQGWSRSV